MNSNESQMTIAPTATTTAVRANCRYWRVELPSPTAMTAGTLQSSAMNGVRSGVRERMRSMPARSNTPLTVAPYQRNIELDVARLVDQFRSIINELDSASLPQPTT